MPFWAQLTRAVPLGFALALIAAAPRAHADTAIELRLASGPHAPDDAPDVIVHIPRHFQRAQPLDLVVFLHGFSSCARALSASEPTPCVRDGAPQRSYGLGRLHERAGTNTVLLVPQLAFLARDASAPRFAEHGGFDAFLSDVQKQLATQLDARAPLRSVTLVAHSAGYRAAAEIVRDPTLKAPVTNLVLCDALYAHWDVFAEFLRSAKERRLISLYTHDAATTRGNKKLAALLTGEAHERLRQERVATPHRFVPERHLEAILRALFGASASGQL